MIIKEHKFTNDKNINITIQRSLKKCFIKTDEDLMNYILNYGWKEFKTYTFKKKDKYYQSHLGDKFISYIKEFVYDINPNFKYIPNTITDITNPPTNIVVGGKFTGDLFSYNIVLDNNLCTSIICNRVDNENNVYYIKYPIFGSTNNSTTTYINLMKIYNYDENRFGRLVIRLFVKKKIKFKLLSCDDGGVYVKYEN